MYTRAPPVAGDRAAHARSTQQFVAHTATRQAHHHTARTHTSVARHRRRSHTLREHYIPLIKSDTQSPRPKLLRLARVGLVSACIGVGVGMGVGVGRGGGSVMCAAQECAEQAGAWRCVGGAGGVGPAGAGVAGAEAAGAAGAAGAAPEPEPCDAAPCVNGSCVPRDGSFLCQCAPGYTGTYAVWCFFSPQ
ncbi:hypothetical protein ACJJTC_006159 [Scirpophaga incertulas]